MLLARPLAALTGQQGIGVATSDFSTVLLVVMSLKGYARPTLTCPSFFVRQEHTGCDALTAKMPLNISLHILRWSTMYNTAMPKSFKAAVRIVLRLPPRGFQEPSE
jgi:hypothetical protein